MTTMLGEEKAKIINEHKGKRIDAQYYMKVNKREKVESMLQEAKVFVSEFDDLCCNITNKEIERYRKKINFQKL